MFFKLDDFFYVDNILLSLFKLAYIVVLLNKLAYKVNPKVYPRYYVSIGFYYPGYLGLAYIESWIYYAAY